MRRWAGSRSSSNASSGTSTSRIARTAWANASWKDGASSPARTVSSQLARCSSNHATTPRATSGAGTSCTRTGLGSARMVAVTSSSRSPGTIQPNPSGRTRASSTRGMCTVTPSASVPGSNW